jgi:LacI family transcriptional regulator
MSRKRIPEGTESADKPPGIKEIAEALGVSIGTVDRALHARPGINALTRAKVLAMAQTLGYRPNLAARFLKSQRQLHIAVQLPTEIASFFDAVREGIREAASPFEPAMQLDYHSYPRLGEGDAELLERALRDEPRGIIIAPGEPAAIKPLLRKAARKNIPVVCVATDAPGTGRLTSVSACPFTIGAMAGELLSRFVDGPGKVAIVTGSLATEDHSEKLKGFRSSLRSFAGKLTIAAVIEAHDDERQAYSRMLETLAHDSPRAVYISTANSLPVLQAITESGCEGRIAVIASDLFPALVPRIRSGAVLASVHQRPHTQGRLAFGALQQFLLEGKCPLPKIRIAPHIVMNSNLDLFLKHVPLEDDSESEHATIRSQTVSTSIAIS